MASKGKAVAALLLGRKGSTGFPGKNTYPVLGKPLAYYPMKAALDAAAVDCLYLSTDDEDLMALARGLGAEVIVRPPELATKEALGEDAYVHGYKVIRDREREAGREVEIVVLLFCNAATILPETIDEGVRVLRENPSYDSAVTVSCYNMWSPLRARRIGQDGLLHPFVPLEAFGDPATMNCDRDSQGDAWFADMSVSIVRPRCLENIADGLLPQKWMGRKIYPLKQWGGLDVDQEWQMPLVEYWLIRHGFNETGERKAAK
ncbi:MAG: cytidylyltransferase [Candidatus Tectomicrobia bacterium]|uniref:Cytidylyltransferase n=1 Tax=Tectimicrobiota bacterium TaxID=2528274 RepID=A0A932HUR5_UNCTE|nr:cytidylyltransferase [Candidatus Tectomicrobia bacterium]